MKIAAYIISSLIGYGFGHYLLDGAAAAYASVLISYHLFLIFLVASAEHEHGISLPIFQTIVTHGAILALLVSLAYAREHIPLFSLISFLIPGLAPFEMKRLFGVKEQVTPAHEEESLHPMANANAEDHEEFLIYLRQEHRSFRKPGMTVDDEFKCWLADRMKKRAEADALAAAIASVGGSQDTAGSAEVSEPAEHYFTF